jgi:hypothetical protein
MLKNVSNKTGKSVSNYKKKDESRHYKQSAPLVPIQCLSYLLYIIFKTVSIIINLSPRKK